MSEKAQDLADVPPAVPAEQAVVAMIHPQALDFFINVLGPDNRFITLTQPESMILGDRLMGLYWDDVTTKLEELHEGKKRPEKDKTMQALLWTCAQQSRFYYSGHGLDKLAKHYYPETPEIIAHGNVGRNIRTTAVGIQHLNEETYGGNILDAVIGAWSEEQADSLPAAFRDYNQPETGVENDPTTKQKGTKQPDIEALLSSIDSPFRIRSETKDHTRSRVVNASIGASQRTKVIDPSNPALRRGVAYPDEFSASRGNCSADPGAMDVEGVAQAVASLTCVGCEVEDPCLGAALRRKEPGVWGGKTEQERRLFLRRNPDFVAGILAEYGIVGK